LKAVPQGSPILEVLPLEDGRGLRLAGELCLSTVGDLVAVLDTLPEGAGVIEVGELSFMDSSGLHAFEGYAARLEPRPLLLRNPTAPVRRLFELTGAYLNPAIELQSDDGHRG
jgi:anti-anti-sigma regulatory factor